MHKQSHKQSPKDRGDVQAVWTEGFVKTRRSTRRTPPERQGGVLRPKTARGDREGGCASSVRQRALLDETDTYGGTVAIAHAGYERIGFCGECFDGMEAAREQMGQADTDCE